VRINQVGGAFGARLLGILLANSAKLFSVPEGQRKLAGGGAKRNHRDRSKKIVRVPAGTPDQNSQQDQSRSGAFSGRVVLSYRFRWLRFAPAPANIPRASGAIGVCQQYRLEPRSEGRRHYRFNFNLHARFSLNQNTRGWRRRRARQQADARGTAPTLRKYTSTRTESAAARPRRC
jgi:hypothetical protein